MPHNVLNKVKVAQSKSSTCRLKQSDGGTDQRELKLQITVTTRASFTVHWTVITRRQLPDERTTMSKVENTGFKYSVVIEEILQVTVGTEEFQANCGLEINTERFVMRERR